MFGNVRRSWVLYKKNERKLFFSPQPMSPPKTRKFHRMILVNSPLRYVAKIDFVCLSLSEDI
jgi:hypothetical protein